MPLNDTRRPAPATAVSVITKVSAIGVPTTTRVSMPGPPLIFTGPFSR